MENPNVFGYVAIGLSAFFYCSLVIPFFNVIRCKLNYEYTPIALINTIYIDSISWYIYGDKILCEQVKLCNMIGGGCTLFLISLYLVFELRKYLIDAILNAIILCLGTLVLHKGLTVIVEDSQMVGKICIGTKMITFCIPILLVFKVFKEKNYKLISINSTLTYMAACIGWALFGKFTNDLNIMIANCLGIILCFIQFVVYLNFKKKFPRYTGTTIGIEKNPSEDTKKDDSTTMTIDEESQEKAKEKPVKIITRIDN